MNQDEFAVEALRKLPTAEAVLSVISNVCTDERLQKIFDKNRGACYESTLKFETVVQLLFSSVLKHSGSGRPAFQSARKNNELTVTNQAAYGKIGRMPLAVSHALLHDLIGPIFDLFPNEVYTQVPSCFGDHHIYGIDGKKIKYVAKRLLETRGTPGKLLGGKILAALSIHFGCVVAMNSSLDGEANDGPLVPGLLKSIHAFSPKKNIILADSQFCDLTTPNRILAYGSDFVMRYHPKTHFHVDKSVKPRSGIDSRGRKFREEHGWLGKPGSKNSIYVRRIGVTRDKEDLVIITSLLDWDTYSASDVLILYGLRWRIETVFQHITKEFDLRHLIGSTAEATIFQFAVTLQLYNIMVLIQQHASNEQKIEPPEISMPKIVRTAKKELQALATIVSAAPISKALERRGDSSARVKQLLAKCWDDEWKKAPKNHRNPKPPPQKKSGAHTSVHRQILEFHRA